MIDGPYSELIIATKRELLSLHMRSYCIPVDPARFANSSFEKAKISQYGVVEELWFDSFDIMRVYHQGLKQKMHQKFNESIDFKNSFSLVVTDRVVFGSRH